MISAQPPVIGDISMPRSQNRNTMSPASLLALRDLDARIVQLNLYGLSGFSLAIVEGLGAAKSALVAAFRGAICGVGLRVGECGRDC
jgi:hypothetical protein